MREKIRFIKFRQCDLCASIRSDRSLQLKIFCRDSCVGTVNGNGYLLRIISDYVLHRNDHAILRNDSRIGLCVRIAFVRQPQHFSALEADQCNDSNAGYNA